MLHQVGLKTSLADDSVSKEDTKLVEEIRVEKRTYRNKFEQMQKCREALAQSRSHLDAVKLEIVTASSVLGEGRSHESAQSRSFGATYSGMTFLLYPSQLWIYVSLSKYFKRMSLPHLTT